MIKQNAEDIFYGKEPNWKHWTPEDFKDTDKVTWSIALAANWYNVRYTERDYRIAVLEYVDRLKIEEGEYVHRLNTDNYEFRSIGGKCQAANKGCILPEQFQDIVDSTILTLIARGKCISVEEKTDEPISVRSRVMKQSCILASELEEEIDDYMEYILGSRDSYKKFDMEQWIKSAEPSGMHCEFMLQTFDHRTEELKMALLGENEQLLEGYNYLSKAQLRKFYDFNKLICDQLKLHMSIMKSNRKPRKKKKKKPEQVVKKLKYLVKDTASGAESILPEEIIGASTVIVYNTKTHKASIFYADTTTAGISVKGSTIVGFDTASSKEKAIRKPTEFIKTAKKDGVRSINNAWKAIKTKESLPTGRINAHTLILRSIK